MDNTTNSRYNKPRAPLSKVNLAKVNDGGVTKLVHVDDNVSPKVELIYCSKAIATLSNEDLGVIINIANTKSRSMGISSVLCFANGHFIQLLEGNGAEVNALYGEISRKTQHSRIQLISFKVAEKDSFATQHFGNEVANKIVCYQGSGEFMPQRFNHDQAIEFMDGIVGNKRYAHQNATLRLNS